MCTEARALSATVQIKQQQMSKAADAQRMLREDSEGAVSSCYTDAKGRLATSA